MTEKIMENVWKGMKTTGNVDEEDKENILVWFLSGTDFSVKFGDGSVDWNHLGHVSGKCAVSDLFYTAKNFCRRISCKNTIQMLCDVDSDDGDPFVSDCVFAEEYGG